MGDDTETVTSRTVLNAAKCSVSGELTTCDDYSNPKLAGADLKWLSLAYNRGLLYQVIGATWTNRYPALLEAFTIKYGQPKLEVKKWQSKAGATFDNTTATWKFKGGELTLESLGTDINTSVFTFSSELNAPPRPKPTIDF